LSREPPPSGKFSSTTPTVTQWNWR
jgi:hypothetical protein